MLAVTLGGSCNAAHSESADAHAKRPTAAHACDIRQEFIPKGSEGRPGNASRWPRRPCSWRLRRARATRAHVMLGRTWRRPTSPAAGTSLTRPTSAEAPPATKKANSQRQIGTVDVASATPPRRSRRGAFSPTCSSLPCCAARTDRLQCMAEEMAVASTSGARGGLALLGRRSVARCLPRRHHDEVIDIIYLTLSHFCAGQNPWPSGSTAAHSPSIACAPARG